LFAFTAVPAHAGGPTSVILSAPPHVAALGYEDTQYSELQTLTDGMPGNPDGDHASGRFVRATWLIHDMSVWRIDIIYPDAPGGPWILSADTLNGQPKPTWQRSTNPAQLLKLLGNLKLLTGQFDGGPTLADGTWLNQPTPAPEPAQPAPAPQTQAETTTNTFTGWRWILPGLLLGAAAALLTRRVFPKRHWELLD
jgi:hypothetical protein